MNLKYSITLLFLIVFVATVNAQVTIGNNSAPASGALLQIKDQDAPAAGPNVTATKGGFLLPRVKLTDLNSLAPIPVTGSESQTGLMVYNISDVAPFKPGIYIWQDTKWIYVVSTDKPAELAQ